MPPRPPGPRVSVVLFLLSESIDGGIKGKKKIRIDMGFQGRGGWGVGGSAGDFEALLSVAFNRCQQPTGHEGPEPPWN